MLALSRRIGAFVFCMLACAACCAVAAAQGPVEVQAFAGEPFGVGAVALNLSPDMLPEPLGIEGVGLSEKSGRVFYPAMRVSAMAGVLKDFLGEESPLTSGGPVRQEVGGILRGVLNRPPRTMIYFLFRGNEPLNLTIQARTPIAAVTQPRIAPAAHRRLLAAWWRDYAAPRKLLAQKPDYPPQVETYLVNSLARRLNLPLPRQRIEESGFAQFEREASALTGGEGVRTALEQDRVFGISQDNSPADLPLPPTPDVPPLDYPDEQLPSPILSPARGGRGAGGEGVIPPPPAAPAALTLAHSGHPAQQGRERGNVKIEAIARHVPAEFFYIRFGSFENFLWFQDTLETWGGDVKNLVALRGLNDQRNQRIQEQLVLEQTQLSRMLGPTVISDVAMVGTDLLMQDGAAIGFLFEARNSFLLGNSLSGPRSARVKAGKAKDETLKIEGRNVSFLSSPDGKIRSYYVVSGDYHFVTSSRTLATRFLQVAKGDGSLGATGEFRHARSVMPVERMDAVFVYFSDAFFRNFVSPAYRIESLRRLQASTDIEVVQLAKLNAATEGKPGETIEELIAGGFLPPGFGPRADGSQVVLTKDEAYDSLRGRRGAFVPVSDVPVAKISRGEAESYARFLAYSQEHFGRVEPMLVGLQHKSLPEKREQVVVDARMTPLQRERIDKLTAILGPITSDQLAAVPGNMAALEMSLAKQRAFGGLRDAAPPNEPIDGRFIPWLKLRSAVSGYLGYQGEPGFLSVLELMFPGPQDANGYKRSLIGLWRLQYGPFALFSFQPEVLALVAPQLRFEPAKQPAQVRLRINDVTGAQIAPFLNNWGYARTRETALGNVRLMHALNQQLHVPAKDCREAAEFLLAAKLVCPLGGQYVLREMDGIGRWNSTKLEESPGRSGMFAAAPAGYVAPPLNWFRGLDLHAFFLGTLLSAHVEVVMQMPK